MNTFKPSSLSTSTSTKNHHVTTDSSESNSKPRKYDENQYLSPAEYHSYSAVDSDTQFYMDDGLSSLRRCTTTNQNNNKNSADDTASNNYVEVMDEEEEEEEELAASRARSSTTNTTKTGTSSSSSSTSSSSGRSSLSTGSNLERDEDEFATTSLLTGATTLATGTSSFKSKNLATDTAAASKSSTFNLVLIDSSENLKAKKILQRI